MKKRFLRDLEVSAIGYGCMGLSHGYGAVPERRTGTAPGGIPQGRGRYEAGHTVFPSGSADTGSG